MDGLIVSGARELRQAELFARVRPRGIRLRRRSHRREQRGRHGAAQRFRPLRSRHGGGAGRRLCGAGELAFHRRGGRLRDCRLRRQGGRGSCGFWGRSPRQFRPTSLSLWCRRRRRSAPPMACPERRCRRAHRLERVGLRSPAVGAAAQAEPRQHDLHVGHHRTAQGRAREAQTPEMRQGGPHGVDHTRHPAGQGIRTVITGPMYHSAPALFALLGSARRGSDRSAAALRRRGHAAADRHTVSATCTSCPRCSCASCSCPPRRRKYDLSSLRWITHGGRTLRACGQARDDRLVGTDDQRVLRRHRDRHRGLAQLGRGTKEARHRGPPVEGAIMRSSLAAAA